MSDFKTVLQPADVKRTQPLAHAQACKCQSNLNIGIFFDGTDNNKETDVSANNNTNAVRLWQAYKDRNDDGFFAHYVSGVGTPFREIDKTVAEVFGGPAGAGGEARILYGLLQIINSVHGFINGKQRRLGLKQLAALCSSTRVPDASQDPANRQYRLTAEQKILDDLGLDRGLVGNARGLREFLSKVRNELSQQVTARATRPQIGAIYIDVFGFSRGAAQARVFVNWLHEHLLIGGNLFGVPSYVRMLGLFDTVASVGLTNAIGNTGHNGWAQAKDLLIHPEVKNCLHYVALHELRTNFPADSVAIAEGTILPERCHEHHCPGAHSDVGHSRALTPHALTQRGTSSNTETRRNRTMRPFQSVGQIARRLIAAFAVVALATGCATSADDLVPDKDMIGAPISGVGHYGSNIGVPSFSLNGRWGGNSSGWGGGGGGVCCVLLPRKITKPVMVNVKWQTCDIGGMKFVNGRLEDLSQQCKEEEHEATVPVHFEVQPGEGGSAIYVHFLPGNRVELWYADQSPISPSYPGPPYPFGPAPVYAPQPSKEPQSTIKSR